MIKNVFLISDTHFGHASILKFFRRDGSTKVRHFADVDEMNEAMVENWNRVVKPTDKVYHLGDVVIPRKALSFVKRLNGEKILIKGNHDMYPLKDYLPYFRDIRSSHVLDGMILTHIPVHESSLIRFGINVHGHTHTDRVMKDNVIDTRYFSVSVEHIDYTPIELGDLRKRITGG